MNVKPKKPAIMYRLVQILKPSAVDFQVELESRASYLFFGSFLPFKYINLTGRRSRH